MKKAKRILAGALAALILTMSLPLSALADEADVPVESPSFEVAFAVDTGQEEISEDPPADIEATPEPTAEPTQEPTPTPESTATPAPTAEPTAVPTATPGVTATPTAVPTSTPEPSAVPSASPVVTPTPTPTPSPQPVVNPVKLEHDVLDNVDKVCIYLFPVPNSSEITQEYSAEHKAIDIAASSGSPVYAAEDGTVSYVQIWDGSYDTTGMMSYGHMVEVRHADGNTTLYAHLSEINVQQGEKVVRGQRIGRVGSTGNATGPHLHFEVITSEGKADPAEYLWTMPGEWIMGYAADTEAGISLTGIGDTGKSVIHFYSLAKETTTTVTGSLGHLPTKAIKSGSTEYPAYCLEKDKLIWDNIDFTWSSFTVPQQTTMKAILAEGFHETNSLDKSDWGNTQGIGYKGNYANETANGYTLLKNNIDVTITSVDDANRPCDIYSKDTLGVIQNDPRYNFPNNEDYKLANIPQKQLAHNYQTASATVDGNDVTMLDDEMDAGSKNAIAPLQVVNTRGFETPMTGENGTWALAIGGVLVFCLGTSAFIFFLVFKRRKEQEDK